MKNAALFPSLPALRAANAAAGGHFFDSDKPGRARLYAGRWVVLTGGRGTAGASLWLADAGGTLAPVLAGEPAEFNAEHLASLARLLGAGGDDVASLARALPWKGGAVWADRGRLTGYTYADAYTVGERARRAGFRLVEASGDGLPYSACWVNDGARASLSYGEGDLSLMVCATPAAWALELAETSAHYRAPVSARLNFDAPAWVEGYAPDVAAAVTESWLYAENDSTCYAEYLAALRPLVADYVRGEYDAARAAPVFGRLLHSAARRYGREFRCVVSLRDAGADEWAAYEAGRLPRRLWEMRRNYASDYRGLSDLLAEAFAAEVARLGGAPAPVAEGVAL